MPLFVVHRFLLVQQTRFHGIGHRGMRNRLQFDFAAVADQQDHRVAHVIRPHQGSLDFHDGQRRGRVSSQLGHSPVGGLDSVQYRITQLRPPLLPEVLYGIPDFFDGQPGRTFACHVTSQTVRHDQHRGIGTDGQEGRRIFADRLLAGAAGREYRCRAAVQGIHFRLAHVLLAEQAGFGQGTIHGAGIRGGVVGRAATWPSGGPLFPGSAAHSADRRLRKPRSDSHAPASPSGLSCPARRNFFKIKLSGKPEPARRTPRRPAVADADLARLGSPEQKRELGVACTAVDGCRTGGRGEGGTGGGPAAAWQPATGHHRCDSQWRTGPSRDRADTEEDPAFGLQVPTACPAACPARCWCHARRGATRRRMTQRQKSWPGCSAITFAKYADQASAEIAAAGPKAAAGTAA